MFISPELLFNVFDFSKVSQCQSAIHYGVQVGKDFYFEWEERKNCQCVCNSWDLLYFFTANFFDGGSFRDLAKHELNLANLNTYVEDDGQVSDFSSFLDKRNDCTDKEQQNSVLCE